MYAFMYMYIGVQIQRLMHVCIFVGENFVFEKGKCRTMCNNNRQCITVFICNKTGLIYTQGLKYAMDSAAE